MGVRVSWRPWLRPRRDAGLPAGGPVEPAPPRDGVDPPGGDLVSLDERFVYLRVLRALVAAITMLDAALLPGQLRVAGGAVDGCALGYVAVCLAAELLWRVGRRRRGWLFGALIVVDSGYLAWLTYLTGAGQSPLRYLVFVHVAAVTLFASYRVGLALALWHSVLQALAQGAGDPGAEWRRTLAFVVAVWALTLTVAALAAVNERELRRRRFELEQLAQMGRRFEDADDPLSVAEGLLDALEETFRFRRLALFEMVDGVDPRLTACRHLDDAVVADFAAGAGSVLVTAQRERQTLLVPAFDRDADPWLSAVMPAAHGLVVVPLVADAVVGVLVAESDYPVGSRIERRVVAGTERFVGHAALAMRNAGLLERMRQMAVTDGLTELANRRSFDRSLEREITRATRTDGRLSVVLLDIDHFKQLNDTHGHVVGDRVLRQVAQALRECGREYDTVARYGGEEFAAVLPGCSSALAVQVAERLRRAVEESGTEVAVTASAGVATFPYDGIDADSLLESADQALYASKRAGRNAVRSAQQVASEPFPAGAGPAVPPARAEPVLP